MAKYLNWHGTTLESQELQRALNRHCFCQVNSERRLERCDPHQLLLDGPGALNRLLFARRIAHRLVREELLADT